MYANIEWHLKHPMPANPTLDERIEWHLAHQKKCCCRKIERELVEEMKKRGLKI